MAMKIQAACPKCRTQYTVTDAMAGRTMRCSKCNTSFVLTAKVPSPAPAPPPHRAESSTVGGPSSGVRSTSGGGAPKAATPGEAPAVIGPYQVRKLLGQGAFGVVYLAYHPFLDIEVAVKLLRAEALASSQSVERFLREAKVLARMDHPNVPRVYNAGKHGDDYYIASAYIPGKDLGAVVPEGGMEPKRAVRLVLQMLRALGYAHAQGILHRDVKPANARLNEQDTLFLMDFGLAGLAVQEVVPASAEAPGRLTRAGAVMGTPAYMAPEQAAGLTEQAGPEADLYSAGVVLYELLTGQLPFEGANLVALLYAVVNNEPAAPSALRPGLDRRLDAICLQALAKRPEGRFRSAEAFAATLDDWLSSQAEAPAAVVLPVAAAPAPAAPPASAPAPTPVTTPAARPPRPAPARTAKAPPPPPPPPPRTVEAVRPRTAGVRPPPPPPSLPRPAPRARRGMFWGCALVSGLLAVPVLLLLFVFGQAFVTGFMEGLRGAATTKATQRKPPGFFEQRDNFDPDNKKSDAGGKVKDSDVAVSRQPGVFVPPRGRGFARPSNKFRLSRSGGFGGGTGQ